MTVARSVWLPFLLLISMVASGGCATAVPQELVSAREAYGRAASGPAAKAAPADLHAAKVALDEAERAFSDERDIDKTRDLGYVAERKAELAEARAEEAEAR